MCNLLICEIIHLTLGLIIGLIAFYIWQDKKLILLAVLSSLVIDIDHLIDYWLFLGQLNFNPAKFFATNFFGQSGKLYLPLHGYEYSFIFFFLSFFIKKYKPHLIVISVALLIHLIFDSISNHIFFVNYSLICRMINNFGV